MSNFLYRFLNTQGVIIYVGKTQNIENRMKTHFSSEGHLPKSCYEDVAKIEYIELHNKVEMDILELYFINKWKPFFNKKDKMDDVLYLEILDNYSWTEYKGVSEKNIKGLGSNAHEMRMYIRDMEKRHAEKVAELEEEATKWFEISRELGDENQYLVIRIHELETLTGVSNE